MTTPLWPIAVGALPQVIDLSHWNRPLSTIEEFAALKAAGVQLVIHKASQGAKNVDPMYAARRKVALAVGLKWDAYHFCTNEPVDAQLAHFLAAATPDATMRLGLDAEQNRGATIEPVDAARFAADLDAKMGRQVLRYGNASVLDYKQPDWRNGPMWYAKYGPMPTVELMHSLGIPPGNVVLWQETGVGRVAGESPVDLSYYRYGTVGGIDLWPLIPGFDGMPLPQVA